MGDVPDIRNDLPVAMTIAAFAGIAWYIAIELNIRLFFLFRRRRGLYFWSCAVASWGVMLEPLTIMLGNFQVWTNLYASIIPIYLSWWIMVIPQSLVLYSRLHLVMRNTKHIRWVLYMIIFTTVVVSIPTIVLGIVARTSSKSSTLGPINMIWDKVQGGVFFVQETIISVLYIIQTRRHLKNKTMLDHDDSNSRQNMRHLIYSNFLVIFLDITLLAIQYANFFYIQGAYKPCVYGVKLRIEFAILNRLISSMRHHPIPPGATQPAPSRVGASSLATQVSKTFSQRGGAQSPDGGTAEYHRSSLEARPYDREGILQITEITTEFFHQKTAQSGKH